MASDHVSRLVFLFSCPQNPSINHLNFCCIKQIDYIFPCVCTVIDHRRRHSVKRTVTPLDFVSCRTFLFFTRCGVICDLANYYSTYPRENVIYLLNRSDTTISTNYIFCSYQRCDVMSASI